MSEVERAEAYEATNCTVGVVDVWSADPECGPAVPSEGQVKLGACSIARQNTENATRQAPLGGVSLIVTQDLGGRAEGEGAIVEAGFPQCGERTAALLRILNDHEQEALGLG